MKRRIAAVLIGAVLVGGTGLTALPHAAAVETVTVSCSNGFSITVAARATRGVMRALKQYNAYNQSGVTCVVDGAA